MTQVIVRVHPLHLTNADQRQAAADPQTRPTDLGCESACRLLYDLHISSPFIITQPKSWRESWKSAPVVSAHLVDDPTIRQPGFTLPRQQWSLMNRFRTGQGHCGVCRKTWRLTDTDLCSCGETQTMSHIVESCPLTKLNGRLSQLHSSDDAAIAWLTNCGS